MLQHNRARIVFSLHWTLINPTVYKIHAVAKFVALPQQKLPRSRLFQSHAIDQRSNIVLVEIFEQEWAGEVEPEFYLCGFIFGAIGFHADCLALDCLGIHSHSASPLAAQRISPLAFSLPLEFLRTHLNEAVWLLIRILGLMSLVALFEVSDGELADVLRSVGHNFGDEMREGGLKSGVEVWVDLGRSSHRPFIRINSMFFCYYYVRV